jgi:hypothetical protein
LNWKACLALVIAGLTSSTGVSLAADLPQRFLGTWMLEDTMRPGNPERCTRADSKPGYQMNDRVVTVDRQRLSPIEGGCRIISAKEAPLPHPRYPLGMSLSTGSHPAVSLRRTAGNTAAFHFRAPRTSLLS